MKRSILHVANNFTINVLYDELIRRLEGYGFNNTVVASTFTLIDADKYLYKVHQCLRSSHLASRLRFKRKIKEIWSFTTDRIDIKRDVELVHAHTLFSDGAVALKAYRKYGTPYVVAVRNTDINIFFKYFIHLRHLGREILRCAKAVILISPAYKERLRRYLNDEQYSEVESKIQVIPNGVNDLWLNAKTVNHRKLHSPVKLIFCGSFDSNKNILRIIDAARIVNQKIPVTLTLIGHKEGDEGSYVRQVRDKAASYAREFPINILDRMCHEDLSVYYRDSDIFIMPSHTETFGLVYVEALSCGLPVLYTRGEGFEGVFAEGTVGLGVKSTSVGEIAQGIEDLINNHDRFTSMIEKINLEDFSWDKIAQKYIELYQSILSTANKDRQ